MLYNFLGVFWGVFFIVSTIIFAYVVINWSHGNINDHTIKVISVVFMMSSMIFNIISFIL